MGLIVDIYRSDYDSEMNLFHGKREVTVVIGAWPDDWSLFQRTLDDVLPWHQHVDIGDL